ncbi:beta-ketoacyl-ACP reductase [Hymenobacter sp. BT635]|uniref:Beta-ketoacyl-ACP reductase n=1 Tax=Hymenobacter nitidus TaxID=2880929 RepID=A0ABS8AGA7_9BACT|nr:beta-ketoacyl synthase N-terminal-like domain-containing protein [Hymenobacter nitidus]MCB2378967.1 beta-ketoacyl-ACP reductase [Hymenobacter nitidus]
MTNSTADSLIVIRGRGRVSALGVEAAPGSGAAPFTTHTSGLPVAALPAAAETALATLRRSNPAYRALDRTVLLALLAARHATAQTSWLPQDSVLLGVSIGSSRGATSRLEQFHQEFLTEGTVPVAASPLTTLGNVASWVAYDAGTTSGAALSHSSTCSSAFQALGNALAWLRAGMAERFLAGGTEAPLTSFTLAQMHALGIYSPFAAADFPCRPGAGKPSTFVLGEGAAVFVLEKMSRQQLLAERADQPAAAPIFCLEGVGFGFEAISSKTGLSAAGQHFQTAMRAALQAAGCSAAAIDAVVLHSPGTPAGDAAERAALRAVFSGSRPDLVSNKWLLGHTLGASAALSLDFACHILTTQSWPTPPFATDLTPAPTRLVRRVLINAAGFGGNAASVVVSVV